MILGLKNLLDTPGGRDIHGNMNVKTTKTEFPSNPSLAWMPPHYVIGFLNEQKKLRKKINPRMLSHWVKVSLGESAKPADGRGSSRMFSIKDVTIMALGITLSDSDYLGLSPHKVRVCCDAVRTAWEKLFPEPFVQYYAPVGDTDPAQQEPTKYLFAANIVRDEFEGRRLEASAQVPVNVPNSMVSPGFRAWIIEESELIRLMCQPKPTVLMNMTEFLLNEVVRMGLYYENHLPK